MFRPYPPTPEDLTQLEAVAEGFRMAMAGREWERACRFLTPKGVARYIAVLLFGTFYKIDSGEADRETFFALLERHGLPTNTRGEIPLNPGMPLALAELIDWIDAEIPEADVAAQLADAMVEARFEDFRILESGNAAATLFSAGRRQNPRFEKTPGGWRLDKV